MSLQQAITEIEGVLDGLSLTKHPDLNDKTLEDSGGEVDGHYLVMPGGNPIPWSDWSFDTQNWIQSVKIEVATIQKRSEGTNAARISSSERAIDVIDALVRSSRSYFQLFEEVSEVKESDNYTIWVLTAQMRYEGATI